MALFFKKFNNFQKLLVMDFVINFSIKKFQESNAVRWNHPYEKIVNLVQNPMHLLPNKMVLKDLNGQELELM
jgi:hypothetical protein